MKTASANRFVRHFGSAVVRHLINETDHSVVNVDKMTYAATEGSTQSIVDRLNLQDVSNATGMMMAALNALTGHAIGE